MGNSSGSILAQLREYVGNRRTTPRRGARFNAHLPFTVSPLADGEKPVSSNGQSIAGMTRDLSANGLALFVSQVRVGDRYLTDMEGFLGVRLELPDGPVSILSKPVRFDDLPAGEAEFRYLISVRIIRVPESDRARYLRFLSMAVVNERRSRERGGASLNAALTAAGPLAPQGADSITPTQVVAAFEQFMRRR